MTASLASSTLQGRITAAYGKRYTVALADGTQLSCVTRGKKSEAACGDAVDVKITSIGEGVIEDILPRKNLLYRSNAFRSKLLAANVNQALLVVAASPSFHEELLNRWLVACEAAGIDAIIVLNKADLPETSHAQKALALYATLGYPIQLVSALNNIAPLQRCLEGKTSILVGQSGMGKTTIVNALLPHLNLTTNEISSALDSGKHTTTATHLYTLAADSYLIDSPGMQQFGIHHLSQDTLEMAFTEFRPYLGQCRFANCRHQHEPGCAIQHAVQQHAITENRWNFFKLFTCEIRAVRG